MNNLLKAMNEVMKKAAYVQKSGKNAFHGYRYASEADLLEVLRPAMVEAGLLLIPSVEGGERMDDHGNTYLSVAYTLAHVSGEIWPEKVRVVGCGNDKSKAGVVGDKGVYKALTGANKYALFKLFQIETGDDPEIPNKQEQATEEAPRRTTPEQRVERAYPENGNGGVNATKEQLAKIAILMKETNFTKDQALAYFSVNFGNKTSRAQLTKGEASKFIDHLEQCKQIMV